MRLHWVTWLLIAAVLCQVVGEGLYVFENWRLNVHDMLASQNGAADSSEMSSLIFKMFFASALRNAPLAALTIAAAFVVETLSRIAGSLAAGREARDSEKSKVSAA